MWYIFSSGRRIWTIMGFAILVAISLISISFYLVLLKNNPSINNTCNNIYDINKYSCEYEMIVYSNKKQNKYMVSEKYLKDESSNDKLRFDFSSDRISFSYIITNNFIGIKSDNQTDNLKLLDYSNNKLNLYSIYTFINLASRIKKGEFNSCKITESIEDNKMIYDITFDSSNSQVIEMFGDNNSITKLEMIIDKSTNIPIQYVIYSDNIVYIDICYKKFEINANFDIKVFDF